MKKPNVILIYPDEMRFDSTSYSGNKVCKTPNYDKMAAASAYFSDAHMSFPLCCPFRASLMTGKYAHQSGMLCNHIPIPLDQEFLPEMMKEHGYRTGWIGKWHLDGGDKFSYVEKKNRLGFDEFIGFSRGHQYLESIYYRDNDRTPHKSRKYEPEYQTDHLIDFASRAVDDGVPFLGMVCFGIPHWPVELQPEHYKHMYSPDEIILPPTVPEWKKKWAKEFTAMYYGMVTAVDDQLGRINAFLKEKGIEKDTILIFVSDHGDMCGEFGCDEKKVIHRGSTQVPFVIQYPRLFGAVQIDQIVDPAITLVPTILDLCGIKVPDGLPGKSLKTAVLKGSDPSLDDYSYYQVPEIAPSEILQREALLAEQQPFGVRGFRTKDYAYVEKRGVPFQLFDLHLDPLEMFNLADNMLFTDVLLEQREKLKKIMEKVDDNWDIIMEHFPETHQTHAAGAKFHDEVYARATYED